MLANKPSGTTPVSALSSKFADCSAVIELYTAGILPVSMLLLTSNRL